MRFIDVPVGSIFIHKRSGHKFRKIRAVYERESILPIFRQDTNCINLINNHRCVMPLFTECRIVEEGEK